MIIRSQDKKRLIPADKFVLSITLDSAIIATKKLAENPSIACNSVIGRYSTNQKAIKVLDMIQAVYENSLYCDHAFDSAEQVQRTLHICNNTVFQMPQDSEVEAC